MKKLFLFAFAAFALAACTDEYNEEYYVVCPEQTPDCPNLHIETVSFESGEMMKGLDDQLVILGDATVEGSFAGGVYPNVYWMKSLMDYKVHLTEGAFDGPLFSTANENIWFGHAYSSSSYGDSWAGFALSADFGKVSVGTYPQFTVWGEHGACNTATCLVGFYSSYSGIYGTPTVEFVKQPRTVCHCYLTNTLLAHEYAPQAVGAADFSFRVKITGSLKGVETGSVECVLATGSERVSDWVWVDLTSLGKVDKLTFVPSSNDLGAYGDNAPSYFAVDEIGFIADKK